MSSEKSNFAFIDGQNLYLGVKRLGWALDYRRFRIYLRDKYKVGKAFLFIGYLPENQELYTELQEAGYVLKFKPVLPAAPGQKPKGNVDADLVLNVMRHYPEYEKAVIVTSDGDFDTTVKYLREEKKLEIVLSPNKAKCSALLQIAARDRMGYLDTLKTKIAYGKTA